LIYKAYDLLPVLIKHVSYRNDAELALLRLSIRLFNSAASALKLARSGYYQPSLSMIRDVIEIQFLVQLFCRDPEELSLWESLPAKDREKRFKPFELRKKLDLFDGFKHQQRARAYKLFCEHAAHPTPNGFEVISPAGVTQVGPFPSKEALTACIQELAKHFPFACFLFSKQVASDDAEVLAAKASFLETYKVWKERHYG